MLLLKLQETQQMIITTLEKMQARLDRYDKKLIDLEDELEEVTRRKPTTTSSGGSDSVEECTEEAEYADEVDV